MRRSKCWAGRGDFTTVASERQGKTARSFSTGILYYPFVRQRHFCELNALAPGVLPERAEKQARLKLAPHAIYFDSGWAQAYRCVAVLPGKNRTACAVPLPSTTITTPK